MKTIEKKIDTAEQRISKLKDLSRKISSFEEYATSRDYKDIAERNIQVAIEACMDIGKIIIANQGLSEPSDNKSIFSVVAEAGIITKESLSFLMPMAGTRNILVHGYDRIDDALIYGIIKKHLNNFEDFLNQIRAYARNST
ncbi:MAG: DUF86 domain-containing protein [Desulfobacterales bacterium]|nr:DUF86 domain-containing protein [Desulfobacterales bacterium]